MVHGPCKPPLQVSALPLPGSPEPLAQRARAMSLPLADDVRERGHQHAASAGDLPQERPPAGSAAQHHDPEEPGGAAAG